MTTWNEIHKNRPWGGWPNEALVRFVKGHWLTQSSSGSLQPPRVLELGCGAGANLRLFGEESIAVAGIDIAPAAIERAIQRIDGWFPSRAHENVGSGESGDSPKSFDLRVGDVLQLPWTDECFDLIIDIGTICCVSFDEAKEAYAEAWRVARKGSFLFVKTFTEGTLSGSGPVNQGRSMQLLTEGPLKGIPPVRITMPADLEELLGQWSIDTVNTESRTLGTDQLLISDLVVIAQKQ